MAAGLLKTDLHWRIDDSPAGVGDRVAAGVCDLAVGWGVVVYAVAPEHMAPACKPAPAGESVWGVA